MVVQRSTRATRGVRRRLVAVATLVALAGGVQSWAAPAASAAPRADAATADLSVSVGHAPSAPFTGETLTFTVTATNAGPAAAADVVAGLSLSYPFRYLPASSPSAASCGLALETGAVLCTLGTIPAGSSRTVTVVTSPYSAGVYQIPVAVASDTADPDTSDRSVIDTVIVQQGPTQINRAITGIYDLVLDRAPTERENRYWSDAWLNSLWERRYRVPLAIISGSESRRGRVVDAYPRILGRAASAKDVAGWSARMARGLSVERFEAALVGSGEFARRNPGRPNTIQAAFGVILGRRASAAELADWTARVSRGTTIGQMAVSLAHSTEGRDRVMERRFRDAVGRSPSNFDRFFWFTALREGSTADVEWAKLLVSDAYLSQFPPIYGGPIPVY
jgi:uncharacterized repeat protein (TIGR01451 family)